MKGKKTGTSEWVQLADFWADQLGTWTSGVGEVSWVPLNILHTLTCLDGSVGRAGLVPCQGELANLFLGGSRFGIFCIGSR